MADGPISSRNALTATGVTDPPDIRIGIDNLQGATPASNQMSLPELGKAIGSVINKDTVAAMLALTGVPDGTRVDTARYSTSHVVGDGSGGEYVYDADSTATIDGGFVMPGIGGTLSFSGTTFNGTAGTGRWLLKDTTVANVMQFGAGTALSDNSPAFNRAFASASSLAHPKTVCFAPGRFTILATVNVPRVVGPQNSTTNPRWRIEGRGAEIYAPGEYIMFDVLGTSINVECYYVPTFIGFDFEGTSVAGDRKSNLVGVRCTYGYGVSFQECTFFQLGTGLQPVNCLLTDVSLCKFHDCTYGYSQSGYGKANISRSRFYGFDPNGVGISAANMGCYDCVFEGTRFKYPIEILANASHVTVERLHYEATEGCQYLFKIGCSRDYQVRLRDIITPTSGTYQLLDMSSLTASGEVIIDGIGGTAPGNLDVWSSGGSYSVGDIVTKFAETGGAVTVDPVNNVYTTSSAHGLPLGKTIRFSSTGTLPGGLTTGNYFVTKVTSNTFKVSQSPFESDVDITASGTGTLSVSAEGNMYQSLTGSSSDPAANPSDWLDIGPSVVCRGPATQTFALRALRVHSSSVNSRWMPGHWFSNPSQWSIAGQNILPRFMEYDGIAPDNNGFVSYRSYNYRKPLPANDPSPVVGVVDRYRTSNTAPTAYTGFTLLSTFSPLSEFTVEVEDSNTSFVNSASMVLLGGANYTATLGDVLRFKRSASKWVQVSGP